MIAVASEIRPRTATRLQGVALALLCLLPGIVALWQRPPLPLDELRYLGVAWEMWRDGEFLVPHINGLAYSHKPPLLFWIIHGGWALFGVNDWWPRLVSPLASLAAVFMTGWLARRLWRDDDTAGRIAPWLLAGCLAWPICAQMVMFDVLLTAWVVLAMVALWTAAGCDRWSPWLLVGLAVGGGILTKGPVILLHIVVPAALMPLWLPDLRPRRTRWYIGLCLAVLTGSALALAWAVPAAVRGGPDYAAAIFWGQTAGRVENSFAHSRPWWFYLAVLPALLLPWSLLPSLWQRVAVAPRDRPMAFLLGWAASVTVAISLISGKQPHYALPILPAFAVIAARLIASGKRSASTIDRAILAAVIVSLAVAGAIYLAVVARQQGQPLAQSGMTWLLLALLPLLWLMARASITASLHRAAITMGMLLAGLLAGGAHSPALAGWDLRAAAKTVHRLQSGGAVVASLDHYQDQFTWLGRLQAPIVVVPPADVAAWAADNPEAYLVIFKNPLPPGIVAHPVAEFPYHFSKIRIWQIGANAG